MDIRFALHAPGDCLPSQGRFSSRNNQVWRLHQTDNQMATTDMLQRKPIVPLFPMPLTAIGGLGACEPFLLATAD